VTLLSDRLAAQTRIGPGLAARIAAPLFFLAAALGLLIAILATTGGHFGYTLDDSYLSLALAERLAQFHYGLNAGAVVAPVASILWPILLVPGSGSAWQPYLPLAINLACGTVSAWLIGRMVDGLPWHRGDRASGAKSVLIACLIVLATDLVGLSVMGLEAGPNVLVALGVAYGVSEGCRGRKIPSWCLWLTALSPLLRYEDILLVIAMSACLASRRRFEEAAGLFMASLILPSLFGVYLLWHALPPIPAALFAQDWSRGDPFIIAFGLALLLGIAGAATVKYWWLAAAAILFCALPYGANLLDAPAAARGIYVTQYQMHRFVSDYYRADFAAGTLGRVSYQLDPAIQIVDLAGLGADTNRAALLTRRERVGLVMLDPDRFIGIPAGWTELAALSVTGSPARIAFYAAQSADRTVLWQQLHDFSATLPAGVRLALNPAPGG
jgi:hypothetical protein